MVIRKDIIWLFRFLKDGYKKRYYMVVLGLLEDKTCTNLCHGIDVTSQKF